MERPFLAENAAALEQLRDVIDRLSDADLGKPLGEGWTVAAALAHLAFWDRYGLAALQTWQRTGQPPRTGEAADINDGALPIWLALPGREAARLALEAAEAIDRQVAALPDALVEAVTTAARTRLLYRSLHRRDHLEQIARALGSSDVGR